jgi:hypothetical protein
MFDEKPKDILNRYNILIDKIDKCETIDSINESLLNINLFNDLYKDNDLYVSLLINLKNKKVKLIQN